MVRFFMKQTLTDIIEQTDRVDLIIQYFTVWIRINELIKKKVQLSPE